MVDHLPDDSATKRAIGAWTHSERMLDRLIQNVMAERAEYISSLSKKKAKLTPTSYIGEVSAAREKQAPTVEGAISNLRNAGLV